MSLTVSLFQSDYLTEESNLAFAVSGLVVFLHLSLCSFHNYWAS